MYANSSATSSRSLHLLLAQAHIVADVVVKAVQERFMLELSVFAAGHATPFMWFVPRRLVDSQPTSDGRYHALAHLICFSILRVQYLIELVAEF